jgi:DNA-binding transcriptional MerR regulator
LTDKGPDAFRTISEAAAEVGEPAHVLRFWETKLSSLRPMRLTGGRRFYRPADIVILKSLRRLLHEDGYSISQVQRLSRRAVLELASNLGRPAAGEAPPSAPSLDRLRTALTAAIEVKARLDTLLAG